MSLQNREDEGEDEGESLRERVRCVIDEARELFDALVN